MHFLPCFLVIFPSLFSSSVLPFLVSFHPPFPCLHSLSSILTLLTLFPDNGEYKYCTVYTIHCVCGAGVGEEKRGSLYRKRNTSGRLQPFPYIFYCGIRGLLCKFCVLSLSNSVALILQSSLHCVHLDTVYYVCLIIYFLLLSSPLLKSNKRRPQSLWQTFEYICYSITISPKCVTITFAFSSVFLLSLALHFSLLNTNGLDIFTSLQQARTFIQKQRHGL